MATETKHTGTFIAYDADGNEYTIYVFTKFIERIEGRKSLNTSDGEAVDRIGKGRYRVLTGFGDVEVTSDDPAAP